MRSQLGHSQQRVADDLYITRGRYGKYEDGATEPPIDILLKMSRHFHVSIDLMVSTDLRKVPLKELMEIPGNRILLPIKVDGNGENKIEIIPHKTSMGYLNGYADPEYIESLQTISLPFLNFGKFRAFPAEGDSMPPHKDGSFIVGKYVEAVSDLKVGKTYVFITRNAGITYKRLTAVNTAYIEVAADNPFYAPYTIPLTDLLEIWQYECSIAMEAFEKEEPAQDSTAIMKMLQELKADMDQLKDYRQATPDNKKR